MRIIFRHYQIVGIAWNRAYVCMYLCSCSIFFSFLNLLKCACKLMALFIGSNESATKMEIKNMKWMTKTKQFHWFYMMNKLPMRCPTGVENTLPANELTLKKDDMFSSCPCFCWASRCWYLFFGLFVERTVKLNKKYTSLGLKSYKWIWFVVIVRLHLSLN